MITLYNGSGVPYPYCTGPDTYYITHAYDGISDTVHMEVPVIHTDAVKAVGLEHQIKASGRMYRIKSIDDRSGTLYIDAVLDMTEWRESLFRTYRKTDISAISAISQVKPAGWYVKSKGNVGKRRTIEAAEGMPYDGVTPLDILYAVVETYGYVLEIDNIAKSVTVVDVDTAYPDSGDYITDEKNLKSIGYTGSSTDLITRLYPYGVADEDGNYLSIASVNGGLEYVDDHTYTAEVISAIWVDERYKSAENLKEAAQEKLKELAVPAVSYELDIIASEVDLWMYKMVTLIDTKRGWRVPHRVVEYTEYPEHHPYDKVVLATKAPSITSAIHRVETELTEKIESNAAKNEAEKGYTVAQIGEAAKLLSGNKGGYKVDILDADGKPYETLYMDQPDINAAQYILRINKSGIGFSQNGIAGPYLTAWSIDGTFDASQINVVNLNADSIVAGTIRDAAGKNSWDLVNGDLKTTSGEIAGFWINSKSIYTSGSKDKINTLDDRQGISKGSTLSMDISHGLSAAGSSSTGYRLQTVDGSDYATHWAYRGVLISPREIGLFQDWRYGILMATNGYSDRPIRQTGAIRPYLKSTFDPAIEDTTNARYQDVECGLAIYASFPGQREANDSLAGIYTTPPLEVVRITTFAIDTLYGVKTNLHNTAINGNLTVTGTKSRAVDTQYGTKTMSAYETTKPYFGDIGEATIGKDGCVHVWLDRVFAETIDDSHYHVWLTPYGGAKAWMQSRSRDYFVICGEPGAVVSWEVKAKQRDYENACMEPVREEAHINEIDYGEAAAAYINHINEERKL